MLEIQVATMLDGAALRLGESHKTVLEHSTREQAQLMGLRDELRAAIARKPNEILARIVYQLRTTRAELALVQETLEKNNAVIAAQTAVIDRFVTMMELLEHAPLAHAAAAEEVRLGLREG